MPRTEIRGDQVKDESIASADLASGSIKAAELHEECISGQPVLGSADSNNDRLLIWDANGSPTGSLKQIAPADLGIGGGGGGSPAGSDTEIQFNDGGSNFGASSNLTWDDTTLKVTATSANPVFTLEATDAGSSANPVFTLKRNSSSPADADYLGQIKFLGENDADQEVLYAKITGKIDDASDGTEDGILEFANVKAGSQTITARLKSDELQLLNGTNLSVDGEIEVSQYIRHMGDSNTHINFTDDKILLKAGNISMITMEEKDSAPHEVRINNGGNNIDFVVEDNSGNAYFTADASTSRVGIGLEIPMATLHVHADSINNGTVTISQSDDSGDASQLDLSKSRGSGASPTVVQDSDFIGQVRMLGYDGDSYDNFADIYAQAADVVSTTSHPTKVVIRTTQPSSTSPTTAVTFDQFQNMTVAGSIYGKMMHMTHHRYNDGSGTGKEYIPWAGTSEQPSPSYIAQGVAPYSGRLLKVLIRSSKSGGLGSTIVGVHKNTDGNTVISDTAEETVTVNMSSANTTYIFNFTNTTHFAVGNVIGVSIDPTNAHGNVNVTCVWEYDITL